MSPYTPHAQIVETEEIHGTLRQPTPEELTVIEEYRNLYRERFDEYPAGTHWVDTLRTMVLLRRPGGLPGSETYKGR